MGGFVSNSCNHLTKEIWTYCTDQKTWLPAVHIPEKDNNTADYTSRLLMKIQNGRFSQNCKFIQSHTRNRPFCFCIKSPGSKIYFMESRSRGICNRCI